MYSCTMCIALPQKPAAYAVRVCIDRQAWQAEKLDDASSSSSFPNPHFSFQRSHTRACYANTRSLLKNIKVYAQQKHMQGTTHVRLSCACLPINATASGVFILRCCLCWVVCINLCE